MSARGLYFDMVMRQTESPHATERRAAMTAVGR
jgi:hypothetical protein